MSLPWIKAAVFLICLCFKMVSFRVKKGWATPRLVSFRGFTQNFQWISLPLSYGSSPRGLNQQPPTQQTSAYPIKLTRQQLTTLEMRLLVSFCWERYLKEVKQEGIMMILVNYETCSCYFWTWISYILLTVQSSRYLHCKDLLWNYPYHHELLSRSGLISCWLFLAVAAYLKCPFFALTCLPLQ